MLSLSKSLFASSPHVTIATALTRDDFIVADLPSEDFNEHSKSIKSKGVALTLKDSAINAIIEAFAVNNTTFAKVCKLDSTMIEFPSIKCNFYAYTTLRVTKDVTYRGLRTKSTKAARFNEIQQGANEEFDSNKATLIDNAIAKLNKSLSDIVSINNDEIANRIKACVVNLNINKDSLDGFMTDEEKAIVSENDAQIAALDEQINVLKQSKKALADKTYHTKRTSIVNVINSTCDQPIKDIANSFADEERPQGWFFSE